MDIDARIERRQRRTGSHRLVRDPESLSPAAHVDEPVGRGPLLERVLDHLDPAFDRDLPANGYLRGPFGAGKSAVVTALFARLDARSTSAFAFYRAVLDGLRDESVPEHGVGTDDLRERLRGRLDEGRGAVVAVDHAGEPDALDAEDLLDLFAGLAGASWLAVGRTPPDRTALTDHAATVIEVEPYRRGELVDFDSEDRVSVATATEAIAATGLDLSPGTIKRYLYELAEAGVLERVRAENPDRRGRPPSRAELRFPPSAFRRLYDRGG